MLALVPLLRLLFSAIVSVMSHSDRYALSMRSCTRCSCLVPTAAEAFGRSSAVFVGVVRHTAVIQSAVDAANAFISQPVDPARLADTAYARTFFEIMFRQTATVFEVERVYKGPATGVAEVTSALSGGGCGSSFSVGERYLVYALRATDGHLWTGFCERTGALRNAVTRADTTELATLLRQRR